VISLGEKYRKRKSKGKEKSTVKKINLIIVSKGVPSCMTPFITQATSIGASA
jgi:hypothetical protein